MIGDAGYMTKRSSFAERIAEVSAMKASELVRAAIPRVVAGIHIFPLYAAASEAGARVDDATYRCAERRLHACVRHRRKVRSRWQEVALYTRAALSLEEEGR